MRRRTLVALVAAIVVASIAAPAVADSSPDVATTDILGQGGDGIAAEDGAKLQKHDDRIKVIYKVATPEPGSYDYPDASMTPPWLDHPEVVPGWPEVFTLWGFVFNYPELCDGPCDGNDIGDTPAQGGVYQIGATVASGNNIVFKATVRVGDQPFGGVPLQNPRGAEVHAAMAPHGQAQSGDELQAQLSGPIGNPSFWWPALFFVDHG
jgi:hypothetical protein